jgi:ABC-type proline/glycine betaine transport system permease subunit
MRTPPPRATLPGINDDRDATAQAIYERTMRRLSVAIRLLTVVLLALVARSVIDGLNIADVIAGTAIALLLIASVGLWRQGCRLRARGWLSPSRRDD